VKTIATSKTAFAWSLISDVKRRPINKGFGNLSVSLMCVEQKMLLRKPSPQEKPRLLGAYFLT